MFGYTDVKQLTRKRVKTVFTIISALYAFRKLVIYILHITRNTHSKHQITKFNQILEKANPQYHVNSQGIVLFSRRWITNTKPKAVIFIVHGYGENCSRYEALARELNQKGFNVYSMDHQGHGLSRGDRVYFNKFSDLVDDYCEFIERKTAEIDEDEARLPFFLLGHSMGGNLAIQISKRIILQGTILSAPMLKVDPKTASPLMKKMAKLMGRFFPKLQLDKIDVTEVSSEQASVFLYGTDPTIPDMGMQANVAHELLDAMDLVLCDEYAKDIDCPILILQGEADQITESTGAYEFYEKLISTSDKTIVSFPNLKHEILQETLEERSKVFETLTEWIESRLD